ncbi:MAG: Holliday junction resolvase RuvX [Rhodobacteraceae bacterium]|nr:Holliday junction resolvase RuvX [Paracoccaceae bacterium]
MIIEDIKEFSALLPPERAIAGLDFGEKTIGVAICDLRRSVATPLEVIRRIKFTLDAATLLALCKQRSIYGLVFGLPLNMDGSEGPRVQATRAFARNLSRLTELPITYWDERLSTVAAERSLIEADISRKRRKEVIDQVAAGYILQGALDRMDNIARSKATAPDGERQ